EGLTAAYTRLFRGPAKLPAPPWGSVYMDRDQVLYGWTWVELRNWMRAHGIQGTYDENDPEDHFARMLLLCSFLANEKPGLLCEFLADHLLCWSERFLALLQEASATLSYPVYEGLAVLAATTLDDIGELLGIQPAARRMHR
ncbi:MAG: molecular chaperone TorD family protein, partial [Eggerthellaceae bacterium]|nr:molecular chaperone TorD family protein [Eggerthellaceae bacterium]